MEAWYKTWCPDCNKVNWVCNGDVSDLTGIDIDSVKCWNCKRMYSLSEDEDDFYYTEDGLEKPE